MNGSRKIGKRKGREIIEGEAYEKMAIITANDNYYMF